MRYLYKTLLVLFYFVIYTQCTTKTKSSFTDKYDLNFDLQQKKTLTWTTDQSYLFNFGQDTTQTINGKHPMYFFQIFNKRNPIKMDGAIEQNILLPEIKADTICVYLRCKSKNLDIARLIISGIDEGERVLYSDTLSILGSYGFAWEAFSKLVPKCDLAFLNLRIEATGINSNSDQYLYLDKMEIKIDGKDINDFPQRTIPIISNKKKSDIIPLSFLDNNNFKTISELRDKKIVAIGETIHGSETITQAAVQLIKYQIENNHCKLIVFEQPIELFLRYNRFIQGDTQFKIENFKRDLSLASSSPRVMVELLNWLKQYNEKAKDKVWLMGMDISKEGSYAAEWLYDYIYKINLSKKNKLMNSLCSKLVKFESFPLALNILEKNKEIENILGKNDYQTLVYCLKMYISAYRTDIPSYSLSRDKEMYSNVSFFLNLLCPENEKAIIFAHFIHTNYLNTDPFFPYSKSFGSYMKRKFGRDYYNIAILTGEGSFMLRNKNSFFEYGLEIPPKNSMENMFMQTNKEYCFKPISTLVPQLTYMRSYGAFLNREQFKLIAPSSRMDGAIFVRKSAGFN